MKNCKIILLLYFPILIIQPAAFAQNIQPTIAVMHLDSRNIALAPDQLGDIARLEVEKTGLFEVLDRYDVQYLVEKENLKLENCYGKLCLVEIGKKLRATKMLSGTVELLGEQIIITLRLIDVPSNSIEKTEVVEFIHLKNQVPAMLSVAVKKLLGVDVSADLVSKLTQRFDYESAINQPEIKRLNLSGPRMGFTLFTGESAASYRRSEREGGLDAYPTMFQFGYQFETTYLNQGGLQAIFEFIPIITGLDQGRIIPSLSVLHGLRSSRNGWEFAFGPIIYLTKEAEGLEVDGKWTLLKDWRKQNPTLPVPNHAEFRFDSRGDFKLATSFVFGVGKSFKSGKMNMPVNFFFIPHRDGHRFGLSFGFNGKG